jgi:hypothetical protein
LDELPVVLLFIFRGKINNILFVDKKPIRINRDHLRKEVIFFFIADLENAVFKFSQRFFNGCCLRQTGEIDGLWILCRIFMKNTDESLLA